MKHAMNDERQYSLSPHASSFTWLRIGINGFLGFVAMMGLVIALGANLVSTMTGDLPFVFPVWLGVSMILAAACCGAIVSALFSRYRPAAGAHGAGS